MKNSETYNLKAIVKIIAVVAVSIILGVVLLSDNEKEQQKPTETTSFIVETTESKEPTTITDVQESPLKEEPMRNVNGEKYIHEMMIEHLGNDFQVESDEKVYYLTPTNTGLIMEIAGVIDGTTSLETWSTFKELMTDLSLATQKIVGDGYSIVILNPMYEDSPMLWVLDGTVVLDAVSDAREKELMIE